jgi:hypothetical protein
MIKQPLNEIYTILKTALVTATVVKSVPDMIPIFPCVTIEEKSNLSVRDTVATNGYNHSRITIEINVFSNTKTKETDVAKLVLQIDNILNGTYRMERTTGMEVKNYNDTQVYRYVLRYDFIIDANNIIYGG